MSEGGYEGIEDMFPVLFPLANQTPCLSTCSAWTTTTKKVAAAATAAGGIDEVGVQRHATWGRHVGTAGKGWMSTLRLNSMLWSVAREWDGVPPKTIRRYPCHQYRSVAGAALPCPTHDPFPVSGSWLVERDQLATAPCPLSRSQIPVFQTLDQAISPCAQRRLY